MADNVNYLQCLSSANETLLTGDDGRTYTIHQMTVGPAPDLEDHNEGQVQLLFVQDNPNGDDADNLPEQSTDRNDSVMTKEAILLLIQLMPKCVAKKESTSGMKKKEVWNMIRREFLLHGYDHHVDQIRNKWRVLERAYKKLTIPRKNGRSRTTCAFQSELDAAYVENPSIMPSMMVGPSDDQPSEDQLSEEDEGTGDFVYEEPVWSSPVASGQAVPTPKYKPQPVVRPAPTSRVMNRPRPYTPKDSDPPMKFNSKERKRKAESAISELVALRQQMADNFARKREESQQRHNEKMALLKELLGLLSSQIAGRSNEVE